MIELVPEVTCDGCTDTHDLGLNHVRSATEARVYLRKEGFTCNRNGDFCPRCVEKKRHLKPSFFDSSNKSTHS